jgi:hypothetical protein
VRHLKLAWTEEELALAQGMKAKGDDCRQIAKAVGRTLKAVRVKFSVLKITDEQRLIRNAKMRDRRRVEAPNRKIAGVGFFVPQSAKPGQDVLAERAVRYAAPVRDLTAAFFNDPPVGYSALERRA